MIVRTKCTVSSNAWLIGAFNPDKMPLTWSGQRWVLGSLGGFFVFFLVGEGIVIYI